MITRIELGDMVVCDLCNTDFSNSDKQGGFLIPGWGICPDCAARFREELKRNGEEHLIQAECPSGMSHKDWILSIRGDNTAILIGPYEQNQDIPPKSDENTLKMYTVYFNLKDYPGLFVVRIFYISQGNTTPGEIIAQGKTIEEVRAKIPAGLYRQVRSENDDPIIIETWF
jgi:hypothetical protein